MIKIITKSIRIHATAERVWRVFTDATLTRRMGGEYVSEWKPTSAIGWKGRDGKMHTSGKIIQVEPAVILEHTLHDQNDNRLLSVIMYEFNDEGGSMTLHAREELHYEVTPVQFDEISQGWNGALAAVKEIAESNTL